MAEIDGENGGDDQPGLDVVSEKLDADHLAGTRIDGGAQVGMSSLSDMPLSTASARDRAAKGADATATVEGTANPQRNPRNSSAAVLLQKRTCSMCPAPPAAIEFP